MVPPHTDPETFGSKPEKANQYGAEDVAICRDGTPHAKGFRLVDEEVAAQPKVIRYFE